MYYILDLTKPNDYYEIINFPDGQRLFEIKRPPTDGYTGIEIRSHFTWADLEIIIQAVTYFKKASPTKPISLFIPYFLGARADRTFSDTQVHYLRDVSAKVINNLGVDQVVVIDPHSVVLEGCIPNLVKLSNAGILNRAISDEYNETGRVDVWFVAPDAGASKKIFKAIEAILEDQNKIVICGKIRDEATGKLTKVWVPTDDLQGKDCWIVDDICSYGGTFKNLAKELKARNAGKIYLVVSHYEGTADPDSLKEAGIEKVYTTNSISDINHPFIKQFNIF